MVCQEETIKSQSILSLTVEGPRNRLRTWLVSGSCFIEPTMVYQNYLSFSPLIPKREREREKIESRRQIDWLFGERDHKFACWKEKMKRRTDISIERTYAASRNVLQKGTDICSGWLFGFLNLTARVTLREWSLPSPHAVSLWRPHPVCEETSKRESKGKSGPLPLASHVLLDS